MCMYGYPFFVHNDNCTHCAIFCGYNVRGYWRVEEKTGQKIGHKKWMHNETRGTNQCFESASVSNRNMCAHANIVVHLCFPCVHKYPILFITSESFFFLSGTRETLRRAQSSNSRIKVYDHKWNFPTYPSEFTHLSIFSFLTESSF